MAKKTELSVPTTEFTLDISQIPDSIEGVIELVEKMMAEFRKTSLVYVWNIGRVIHTIQDDEGRYGSGAVERVAEEMGQTPRLYWEMLRFYNYHEDFDEVKQMAIEWSAAREIMRLPDPRQREKLEQKAEEENLTVRQVREAVNEAKGRKPKEPKKKSEPKALEYFLKLENLLENHISDLDVLLKNLSAMLAVVSDEDRTPDEDYSIIVEGTEEKPALVDSVSRKALSEVEKLRRYVVPLKDAFHDEDTEPQETEEPA